MLTEDKMEDKPVTKPLYSTVESKAQLLKEHGLDVISCEVIEWRDKQLIRIKADCEDAVNVFKQHRIDIKYVNYIQPCDKHTGKPQGDAYYLLTVVIHQNPHQGSRYRKGLQGQF